jgi:hypothetical protein
MSVVRIAVDIRVRNSMDVDEMEKLSDSVRKYAYGVVTDLMLDGDERVEATVHQHQSTGRYACEECVALAEDEIN